MNENEIVIEIIQKLKNHPDCYRVRDGIKRSCTRPMLPKDCTYTKKTAYQCKYYTESIKQ